MISEKRILKLPNGDVHFTPSSSDVTTKTPNEEIKGPLALLDEIRENPSPPGAFKAHINNRDIDLHIMEKYIMQISPYSLKTIIRYHNARTLGLMKGYDKTESKHKRIR